MKAETKKRWKTWGPAGLYAALIFAVSSIPYANTEGYVSWSDKTLHTLEYAIFGLLIMRGMSGSRGRTWQSSLYSIFLAAAYGITDELHQYFVPGRSCDYRDWIADITGATVGILVYHLGAILLEQVQSRRSQNVL